MKEEGFTGQGDTVDPMVSIAEAFRIEMAHKGSLKKINIVIYALA